ncbi:MAG TPA: FliI/YscN family ATPase [Candidatus Hydrogenedentes bacterium]|nr:FliI/YscN family ATPase [Candidatus Hydrogenedentota bacterium]HQH50860.1 FliI/YscN family ATPase [Candidatus Hydrogenedentota bacterium]HQM48692.1 FliI/YscN family ATPase [Candidatus Hydrogenedentota bacterium]
MATINLDRYQLRAQECEPVCVYGRVVDVVGLTVEATGPAMRIGDLCYVQPRDPADKVPVEVVGFRGKRILLMPLGDMNGIAPNSLLIPTYKPQTVHVGDALLGRVIDSMGMPLDDGPVPKTTERAPLTAVPPRPLERTRIETPVATGIRAIDACITCGKGQRMGVMSGSGIGKSKMIGMIARNTSADVNVIGLIGERGREVREFVEGDLGPEGLARSVVVVATSDEPALRRVKGAYMATAIAEWFRERGADVMLMLDSITRFAMAQREVGLAIGEPPTTKGYPPSVYSLLPKLLERAGTSPQGSITGIYAVLVEADDINDPIGDAVRSILDGHIALSRDLATRGHYPAIDVTGSVSRCMIDVVSEEHQRLAREVRRVLATYRDAEDLVNIGAYVGGSNPEIDRALKLMPKVRLFLQQGLYEESPFEEIERLMRNALQG